MVLATLFSPVKAAGGCSAGSPGITEISPTYASVIEGTWNWHHMSSDSGSIALNPHEWEEFFENLSGDAACDPVSCDIYEVSTGCDAKSPNTEPGLYIDSLWVIYVDTSDDADKLFGYACTDSFGNVVCSDKHKISNS